MASVISFCFLLLVAYSYSAPILQEYENSTSEYEYTTNPIIVEHVSSINMHLLSDDESTGVPTIQKSRSSEESNSDEITTDNVARSSRTFEQSSYPFQLKVVKNIVTKHLHIQHQLNFPINVIMNHLYI